MNKAKFGVENSRTLRHSTIFPPIFLFILSLAIRVFFITNLHFDGLYGQDSFAYFNQAVAIAENFPSGQLPPLDFFWPNGYPLLAAVFIGIFGKSELAVLLPVLLTGSAIAPLAYIICREFLGEQGDSAGWLAGLIISVAGQPILSSITSMADSPGLFWAMLATWSLARAWEYPSSKRLSQKGQGAITGRNLWELQLTLAGFFLALATITRWNYAILAVPFAVYSSVQTWKNRAPIWPLIYPTMVGFSILLIQVWLSSHRPEGLFHQWLVGWHPHNFFTKSFQTPDGLLTFERPVGLFNILPAIHPAYMFPLLGLAVPIGVWQLWRERNCKALILLGGWIILTYAFLSGIPYENFRFGLSLYPPLVILAGCGIVTSFQGISKILVYKKTKLVYLTLIGGSLFFMLLWTARMVRSFLEIQTVSKMQVREIASQLPPNATIITLGPTLIFDHYTSLHTIELFSSTEMSLKQLLEETFTIYLLLDLQEIESQWFSMSPYENYKWLQVHTHLMLIAEYPPYSLFQVIPSLDYSP